MLKYFAVETIILRTVATLLLLVGFALNLQCDPLHEWMGDSDHHAQVDHDTASHDAPQDEPCRPHCQLMHTMTWPPATEADERSLAEVGTTRAFFYENHQGSRYSQRLLRPPTALLIS